MAMASGSRLGAYEILGPAGSGGMGEVYRARDTRLDRTVAIKLLPEQMAASPEARQRFDREARSVSALNHPHICTLHDVGSDSGVDFLVMEFVDGETLDSRLKKGRLPLDQALKYAIQIADALDAAHRQGIVHRDLKPGNIMITAGGVKILDFGLAKSALHQAAAVTSGGSVAQTLTTPLTGAGAIIGTLQYMAPEQLEGAEADARSDIFSFGAVLYEMLTGDRAFEGKSQASLIASILEREPAAAPLEGIGWPLLARFVNKCLAKDRSDRWQTARDAALELRWLAETGPTAAVTPVGTVKSTRERAAWAVATLLFAVLAWYARGITREPQPASPVQFTIPPPEGTRYVAGHADLSRDGRKLVFLAGSRGQVPKLWVRTLDAIQPRELAGTEEAEYPFLSADGRSVGFFAQNKLKIIDTAGGGVQVLCDLQSAMRGGTWNKHGVIVFGSERGPLFRIASTGGAPAALTQLDAGRKETFHRGPRFLPDDQGLVFRAGFQAVGGPSLETNLTTLDNPTQRTRLPEIDGPPVVAADTLGGPLHLIYRAGNSLYARPFRPGHSPPGDPVLLSDSAPISVAGVHGFASLTGTMGFLGGGQRPEWELAIVDRGGKKSTSIPLSAGGSYNHPEISPDGTRLVADRMDPGTRKTGVWIVDLVRGTSGRLTFDPADGDTPVWSADGKRVYFTSSSVPGGPAQLFETSADGSGQPRLILSRSSHHKHASPDGRFLAFEVGDPAASDVWVLSLDAPEKARPLLPGPGKSDPRFSPDGKWLAYSSNESGRYEIFVQSFPTGGGKWQVSTSGGWRPRWRHDGKEIYFMAPDKIMAAAVEARATSLVFGQPEKMFDAPRATRTSFGAALDGKRFLIGVPLGDASPASVTMILNWTAGLKK